VKNLDTTKPKNRKLNLDARAAVAILFSLTPIPLLLMGVSSEDNCKSPTISLIATIGGVLLTGWFGKWHAEMFPLKGDGADVTRSESKAHGIVLIFFTALAVYLAVTTKLVAFGTVIAGVGYLMIDGACRLFASRNRNNPNLLTNKDADSHD